MKPLQPFIDENLGKEVDDGSGNYKGECVSLIKRFVAYQSWPPKRGNAINWQYNSGNGYKWIKNYSWTIPQPGDLAVFNVGSYGHIGIVVKSTRSSMQVLNQNWPTGKDTDPVQITTFDFRRPPCIGFLRYTG